MPGPDPTQPTPELYSKKTRPVESIPKFQSRTDAVIGFLDEITAGIPEKLVG
jgi:hypothetical protein